MKKAIFVLCALSMMVVCNSCSKAEYDLFATFYGVVSDKDTGEPIANASVVLTPGSTTKVTGADGSFEFQNLEAGQYSIQVTAAGYKTDRKTPNAIAGEKTSVNIQLVKND